ncbi:hypothetical protein ACQ5SP_05260 [Rhodovulum sp. YNF3179]|uniref:hypothetical protein n=1 Tax=Rhodovulum sp. YNF3179 TaxID=3425127 RepID=UPI003D33CD61
MFDINPQTHRHYLSDIDRQFQPRMFEHGKMSLRDRFGLFQTGAGIAVLAVASFVLGGLAGGTLL